MTPQKRKFNKTIKARKRRAEYLRSKNSKGMKIDFSKPIIINPKEVSTSKGFFEKLNRFFTKKS